MKGHEPSGLGSNSRDTISTDPENLLMEP